MKSHRDYYKQFRKIIIVGGSSGIGFCLAKELAHTAQSISLIARNSEKLGEACEVLASANPGTQIFSFAADVGNRANIESALHDAIASMQGVDFLIVTAGIAHPGRASELDQAIFHDTIAINYLGGVYCVQYCLSALQNNAHAKILLTSSVAGLIAIYGYSPYAPSKAAISMYGQILQQELGRSPVSVSILYPPDTNTEQLHYEERFKPDITKTITRGGGLWEPNDVARHTLKNLKKTHITPGITASLIFMFSSLVNPALRLYTRFLCWKEGAQGQ